VPQAPADHIAHLVQTNFPVSMKYPADWMQLTRRNSTNWNKSASALRGKSPGSWFGRRCRPVFVTGCALLGARDPHRAWRGWRLPGGRGGFEAAANREIGVTNSAAMLGSDGALSFLYDKIHLVPFTNTSVEEMALFAKD